MRLTHASGHPGGRRGFLAALLVLLAAALVLGAGQPLHVHADAGVGLYNETHVLSAQATLTGGAPLPAAAVARWVPPALPLSLPAREGALPAPTGRSADSRAPPLA